MSSAFGKKWKLKPDIHYSSKYRELKESFITYTQLPSNAKPLQWLTKGYGDSLVLVVSLSDDIRRAESSKPNSGKTGLNADALRDGAL